jgi:cleavage stimulation factor subunit 3
MASDATDNANAQLGGSTSWGSNEWSGKAEINESNIDSGEQQEEYPAMQTDPTSDDSDNEGDIDEDSAEYDPESVEISTTEYNPESIITMPAPPVVEERSASNGSSRPTKKPKTAGGFIVGSSDDEDETPALPAGALKPNPNPMPPQAPVQPPSQQATPTQDALILPSQTMNGSVSTAAHIVGGPNPKSRLPADVVGMLEDRIKDDPKGDTEAWFALIEEQKRRHKIEDTRNTYERFLAIFPQAVRKYPVIFWNR